MTHLVNTDWNLIVALPWFHDICIPPAPPVPGPGLDIPCTQKWAGFAISGKFSTKVMHRGEFICLDGHNVGMLILHITYPPSWMLAIIIPFSERKMSFSASKVQIENKPVACAQLIPIPTPMMDCGDPVGNPLTPFPMNFFNTVEVGMTMGDFWAGLAGIVVDLVIDLAFFKFDFGKLVRPYRALFRGGWKGLKTAIQRMGRQAARETGETIAGKGIKFFLKQAAGKFIPLGKEALLKWGIKQACGSILDSFKSGDPTLKVKVGHGNFGEIDASWSSEKGVNSAGNAFGKSYDTSSPSTPDSTASSSSANSNNSPQVDGNPPPENLTP